MLTQLQTYYIDEVVNKLINYYENDTKKKFNTRDLEQCLEFIKWLNGDVVFGCRLDDRYGVDGAVVNINDGGFAIFVDEKSLKNNIDVKRSAIGTIYRMLWFHIKSWVSEKDMSDEGRKTNRLLYPKLEGLTADDLLSLPEIKESDSIQKKISLGKNVNK